MYSFTSMVLPVPAVPTNMTFLPRRASAFITYVSRTEFTVSTLSEVKGVAAPGVCGLNRDQVGIK